MSNRIKLCIWFNLSDPDQKRAYDLIKDTSRKNGNSLGKCVSDLIAEPQKEVSFSDYEAEKIARLISKRLIETKLFPTSSAILNEENVDIKPDVRPDVSSAAVKSKGMNGDDPLGESSKEAMNAIYKMAGLDVHI